MSKSKPKYPKKLLKDIKEALAEYKRGEYFTFEQVFGMTPEEALMRGENDFLGWIQKMGCHDDTWQNRIGMLHSKLWSKNLLQ